MPGADGRRRGVRTRVRVAAALAILALAAPGPVPTAIALEATTLTITSVPVHPVANTVHRFTALAPSAVAGWMVRWAVGPIVRPETASDRDAAVRSAGAWGFSRSSAWWGRTARWSSTAGATASFTFTGRSVGWVSLRGPGRGQARIYVDGKAVATIDLGAATTSARRLVWVGRWPTSARRTVTVRGLGTVGRPRVDLDGFVVLR